jgi:hypothetical protein
MELSAAIPLVEAVGNFQSEQFMADAVRTVLAALLESQRERDAALAGSESERDKLRGLADRFLKHDRCAHDTYAWLRREIAAARAPEVPPCE